MSDGVFADAAAASAASAAANVTDAIALPVMAVLETVPSDEGMMC